jgi:hypothetical protein
MAIGDWMKEELKTELATLEQIRDELRVQANLGKAELRDTWEGLEKRWTTLEGKVQAATEQAKDDASDVRDAVELLVGEIREGYAHLKSRL